MKIIELSVNRRVTISMFTVAILLFGMVSQSRLKMNLLPDLSYPTITVRTEFQNAAPAEIENLITNETEIDQCMVYGDKKNYLVALIVPSKDFAKEKDKIKIVIEKINKKLTLLEKIKRIQLIDENFSIENGLMTPTMKVKRKKVTEKYKNQLEELY